MSLQSRDAACSPRRRIRFVIGVCGLTLAIQPASVGWSLAQTFQVEASIRPLSGAQTPGPGDAVEIALTYRDMVSGRVTTKDINPQAWLRVLRPNGLPCGQAVGAYRLRMVSSKDVSALTGQIVTVVNPDGTVHFIDRFVNLATANTIAIARLGEAPVAVSKARGEVAALLPRASSLVTADLSGEVRTLATGFVNPTALAAQGERLLVGDDTGLHAISLDGKVRFATTISGGVTAIVPVDGPGADIVVRSGTGSLWQVDGVTGQSMQEIATDSRAVAVSRSALAILAKSGDAVTVTYAPDFKRGSTLNLEFDAASGIVADALGAYAFVWSNKAMKGALIDLVYGRIVDTMDLPAPLTEALFSGRSIFVAHADSPDISLIDTGTVATTGRAAIRTYTIDSTVGGPTRLAVDDADRDTALAIPAEGYPGLVFGNGNPTAPLNRVTIRGGASIAHLVLDRNFIAGSDDVFRAIGRIPTLGPVELVTVGGSDNTVKCFPVASSAPLAQEDARITVVRETSEKAGVLEARVKFEGLLPRDISHTDTLEVEVGDLFGNRASFAATRRSDGAFGFSMRKPPSGTYHVVVPDLRGLVPGRLEVE